MSDDKSSDSVSPDVATFVRERRRARGLSQGELAEVAGVGRRFISDIENAKPTVRLDKIETVLSAFGKCLVIADQTRDEHANGAPHE